MTERDFVLNNINKYEGVFSKEELNVHLKYAKDLYKTILENTSEVCETVKEIEHIIEFIGFGGLTDISQMHVKKQLFDLKNKIQTMV